MRFRVAELTSWAVLSVGTAAWLALVEVLWLPLRVDGVLVPVSVVAAAVGNPLVIGVTWYLSRSRVVTVLPALTWLAVAVGASMRTPEGDLLVVGNGVLGTVGLIFLLVGVLRLVQVEARPHLRGAMSWVPYLAALVVAGIVAAFALKQIGARRGR